MVTDIAIYFIILSLTLIIATFYAIYLWEKLIHVFKTHKETRSAQLMFQDSTHVLRIYHVCP